MGASAARAARVVAVLSSDSDYYHEAFEGFQEEWGSSVTATLLNAPAPVEADAVVAFGSRAALKAWPGTGFVVSCLAPAATAKDGAARVALLPDPAVLLARMKKLMPRLKVLRVLWSSGLEEADVRELADAAAGQEVTVISERVANPALLPERIRTFSGSADALWLMPDPVLVNAKNFRALTEYAAAARVPFFAPTEGLAEKGATVTLAAPFRDVGRAAAVALRARLRGERTHDPLHPTRVLVTVSLSAARAAGLELSSSSEVDRTVP